MLLRGYFWKAGAERVMALQTHPLYLFGCIICALPAGYCRKNKTVHKLSNSFSFYLLSIIPHNFQIIQEDKRHITVAGATICVEIMKFWCLFVFYVISPRLLNISSLEAPLVDFAGFLIDCSLCQERFALIRAWLRRIEFHLFPIGSFSRRYGGSYSCQCVMWCLHVEVAAKAWSLPSIQTT